MVLSSIPGTIKNKQNKTTKKSKQDRKHKPPVCVVFDMYRSIWIQGSVWLTVQFAQLWSQTCAWILPVWYIINAYWRTNKAPIMCKILEREKKSSLGGRWSLSVSSSIRCCRVTINTDYVLSHEGTTSLQLLQLGIGVHTGFMGLLLSSQSSLCSPDCPLHICVCLLWSALAVHSWKYKIILVRLFVNSSKNLTFRI